MLRQDKATTERHLKILHDLVKRPENRVCADCKKNDPRWASWNIGVFLCIRCSGIHRGMGTHISKVKSVDLDSWTPEQMESIQKWGNYLANLYWEAHLKPGHTPPDHKMESFIRSKYESRKWARDGQPPTDPSVLAPGGLTPQQRAEPPALPTTTASPSVSARSSLSRSPQTHQLLSANFTSAPRQSDSPRASLASTAAAPVPPASLSEAKVPENDLFSLDFHGPPTITVASTAPKKDVKQDILSLFSSQPPAPAPAFGKFSGVGALPQQQQVTSMMGNSGIGVWGASSGWSGVPASVQVNPWATANTMQQPVQANLFSPNQEWNPSAPATMGLSQNFLGTSSIDGTQAQKKDDVFGDIWGGFK